MKKSYTKDFIEEKLCEKKLKVLGDIKTSNDKVLCETLEGYRVMVIPYNIICQDRKGNLSIFSKYNPYTIYNIKLWLKLNHIDTLALCSTEYNGSTTPMLWKCNCCNNNFYATWDGIRGGKRYCNYCAKSKRYDNLVDYNKLVAEECKKRNYTLLPDQDIKRSTSKFLYICNKHKEYGAQESCPGEFITSYGKGGCTLCCIEKRSRSKRKGIEYFKKITEDAGMIFENVEYSKNDRTRILYRCPKHKDKGVLSTYVRNMKSNKGNCPYCIGRNRSQSDLEKELKELHLNVKVLKYTSYSEPILVQCGFCGFTWETSGINLTQGHSCPNCPKSHFELSVQNLLDENNVSYICQYSFPDCKDKNPLPFDFYIPNINTLIEVDGEGHYIPIRRSSNMTEEDANNNLQIVQKHDRIKDYYCEKNNINLIRIPYWERANLSKSYIYNLLKNNNT